MSDSIYRIVYCSRNSIGGTDAEIAAGINKILSSSRANNSKVGVTGALIFNSVFFAQVLEGPLEGVERIFEKIQRDSRHADLTVLQSGFFESRAFPEWSMAFASANLEDLNPLIVSSLNVRSNNLSVIGTEVISLLRDLVLKEEDWALPCQAQ